MEVRNKFSKRIQVGVECGPSQTKQSFKDECDINNILGKYRKTGVIEHLNKHGAEYGFASGDTFQDAMNIVSRANSMFEELPAHIRSKFNNEPAAFLDFVQDEGNIEEMRELGLAKPETPKPPKAAQAASEPSGTAKTDAGNASMDAGEPVESK